MAACCAWFAATPAWSQSPSCGESLGDGARRVNAGALTLAWVARPQPIPLDRHFQLDLMLCGATVEALRVDADMPAHRHGMNYRTSLTQTGPGRYRAEGLLFHMPGRWRLIVDVDEGGRRQRLTDEILVR
jgi:YtkA-like